MSVAITTEVFDKLKDAFTSKKFDVYVLEGGSRSSKTFSIIQFWILWSYMNRGRKRRVLVSRRKGTWLTATVVNDFLNVLKLYGLYNRKNHNKSTGSGVYTLYDTEFWFIGLDDTQRIHGFESDAFWINEAVEALYDDYAQIMQRCKGFAILDYNPSEEEHWIYDRVLQRPLTYYSHSTMLNNPFIAGTALRQILSYEPTDANYKAGTADERKWKIYGLGQRAKIEGVIFEYKMIPKIPQWVTTSRYGLDFGYTNDVTACSDVYFHENNVYIDEMFYKTGMLSSDIVKEFKELPVKKIWCDSADPRLIDEIYNAGINIHPARKPAGSIKAGIDWLKTKNIYITENSLNAKKEFDNYTYQQDKNGMWLNEPIDAHNHCFVGETMITTINGQKRIDEINVGDLVATSNGYRKVTKVFDNGCKKIHDVSINFGIFAKGVKATPDHKFKTTKGWKQLKDIKAGDVLYLYPKSGLKDNPITERYITNTRASGIIQRVRNFFIGSFGKTQTGQYPRGFMCTILTATKKTTISKTLNAYAGGSTLAPTCKNAFQIKTKCKELAKECNTQGLTLPSGTAQRRVENGTKSNMKNHLGRLNQNNSNASSAIPRLKRLITGVFAFAQTSARRGGEEHRVLITSGKNAQSVEACSQKTNTVKPKLAVKYAVKSLDVKKENIEKVYDIEVEGMHEYFANGILVHNCIDGVRYVAYMEFIGKNRPKNNLLQTLY